MVPYRLLAIVFRLTVLCGIANVAAAAGPMDVEYSWVFVDYTFPSPQHRESAVKSGRFIPENCVILDVDVYQGNTHFTVVFHLIEKANSRIIYPFPVRTEGDINDLPRVDRQVFRN